MEFYAVGGLDLDGPTSDRKKSPVFRPGNSGNPSHDTDVLFLLIHFTRDKIWHLKKVEC